MCIYIYIYIHTTLHNLSLSLSLYMYIYIYIYIGPPGEAAALREGEADPRLLRARRSIIIIHIVINIIIVCVIIIRLLRALRSIPISASTSIFIYPLLLLL